MTWLSNLRTGWVSGCASEWVIEWASERASGRAGARAGGRREREGGEGAKEGEWERAWEIEWEIERERDRLEGLRLFREARIYMFTSTWSHCYGLYFRDEGNVLNVWGGRSYNDPSARTSPESNGTEPVGGRDTDPRGVGRTKWYGLHLFPFLNLTDFAHFMLHQNTECHAWMGLRAVDSCDFTCCKTIISSWDCWMLSRDVELLNY